jgi:acyl dehydratase
MSTTSPTNRAADSPERPSLRDWATTAVNLPDHADNPIHTDAGARAQGFDAALVAGVTVYAYLSHVPATAWGLDWVAHGGSHVRFLAPVVDGDTVECVAVDDDGVAVVEARVGGERRARCEVYPEAPRLPPRDGEVLAPERFTLDGAWLDYGLRAGDDCTLYAEQGIAHPALWLSTANRIFHRQLVTGPWIHVRSLVAHHRPAPIGSTIEATAIVVDRFETRTGRRAVADVEIRAGGELVATLEHEAIIHLA